MCIFIESDNVLIRLLVPVVLMNTQSIKFGKVNTNDLVPNNECNTNWALNVFYVYFLKYSSWWQKFNTCYISSDTSVKHIFSYCICIVSGSAWWVRLSAAMCLIACCWDYRLNSGHLLPEMTWSTGYSGYKCCTQAAIGHNEQTIKYNMKEQSFGH